MISDISITFHKVETFFNSSDVKIEAFDLSSNMIFAATQSQQLIVLDALSESVRIVFNVTHII